MKYIGVDVEIEDVQKQCLEVLCEFDRICKKNNIKYQLFAGTLLGAIRHKGFIPWDDDVDVCLLRKDYNKFIECCKTDLDPKYFLQNCFTDKKTIVDYSKIRKNGTVFENDVESPKGSHLGFYIDVFPLDNVADNLKQKKKQIKKITFYHNLSICSLWTRVKHCNTILKKSVRFLGFIVVNLLTKTFVDKKTQKWLRKYENENTIYASHLSNCSVAKKCEKNLRIVKDFYNITEAEFCGKLFPVPVEYDKILTRLYGKYMELPPEEERYPHHRIIRIELGDKNEKI